MAEESVEALLERIQRHLNSRAGQGQAAAPSAAATTRQPRHFAPAVYDRLAEAEAVMDAIAVQPVLTPQRLPVVGGLWRRVRAAAHQLVVFYVNRLAGAQAAFNREITGALAALVEDLDRHPPHAVEAEIVALRAEVQALRRDLEALKAARAEGRR